MTRAEIDIQDALSGATPAERAGRLLALAARGERRARILRLHADLLALIHDPTHEWTQADDTNLRAAAQAVGAVEGD